MGFIVPDYNPSQEEKEHQQVVDEIYEAYNIEITVVHDGRETPETEESLVGKTFRIDGDEVISFGSSNSATVVLPTEHYVNTEATIRMWGSQYYMFSGRKTETLGKKTCWCCIFLCVVEPDLSRNLTQSFIIVYSVSFSVRGPTPCEISDSSR